MRNLEIKRIINGKEIKILLTNEEMKEIIEESEKENIFEDFLKVLDNDYDIDIHNNPELEDDINKIYQTFNHVYDSDKSWWENIDKTIEKLKEYDNTAFNYNKLR